MSLDLYIGNKNYSSWSLRPWLLLKHLGIPFTEHMVSVAGRDYNPVLLPIAACHMCGASTGTARFTRLYFWRTANFAVFTEFGAAIAVIVLARSGSNDGSRRNSNPGDGKNAVMH